jgi:predicted phosphodiesterase
MAPMKFGWLHVSDLHLRPNDDYDRDIVLRKLVAAAKEERSWGRRIDAIFVTGDVVSNGSSAAYTHATSFLDELLKATGLSRKHVFVVPGNHDVNRERASFIARTLENIEESDRYFAPDQPKYHFDRLMPYAEWYNQYFKGIRSFSTASTCGPVEVLPVDGRRVGIVPINTALFSVDDRDHEKLWIGRRCLERALDELKDRTPDMSLVLMHHPLDFLHGQERQSIIRRLEESINIVLRGHLHENGIQNIASSRGRLLHLAAGAAYQGARHRKLALFGRIEDDDVFLLPFRYFDDDEAWHRDPTLFRTPTNEGRITLPGLVDRASASRRVVVAAGEEHRSTNRMYTAEELANRTVAAARDDDDVFAALLALTGLSRMALRRRLNGAADVRVRLRSLFDLTTQPSLADGGEPEHAALGSRTIASVRSNEAAIAAIAAIVGVGERTVSNRLQRIDGRFRVRTIFPEGWPSEADSESGPDDDDEGESTHTAEELAGRTVAATRDDDEVLDSLAALTGRSLHRVRRELAAADGRTHLATVFARWWPTSSDDAEVEPDQNALGSRTVASVRDDQAAIVAIAATTGLSLGRVSNQLQRADGRYRVRTIFAQRWPAEDGGDPGDREADEASHSAEDLAERTVAAVRDDDEALDSLAGITGLTLKGIRRRINGAGGRALLRNLFADRWPVDETGESQELDDVRVASYSATDLADWNAATARHDEEALDALSMITGISRRWIRRHLNSADGRTRLRNVFAHRWPDSEDVSEAVELGSRTIASIRNEPSMLSEICAVTGLAQRTVAKRIDGADGRFRVRTIFRDRWPDQRSDEDERSYSAEQLADWTVAAARGDDDAFESLVAITGISPRWVRRHLNGADGRTLLRNLFADHWPSDTE